MKTTKLRIFILVILLLMLAACNAQSEDTTATPEPVTQDFNPVVSATGEIVPEKEAHLTVKTAGVVAEVLVAEGDTVTAGQALLRLEGAAQLGAAVSAAEFELSNAQYALNTLYDDTDLMAAQALQSAEKAERALEDLNNLELQTALAEQAVADAQKAVDTTERRLRNTQSIADQADIDAAKAEVILAQDVLDKAQDDFEPYADKAETNLVRANLQSRLAAAQIAYDDAVRNLNALQGTSSEVDINVAAADYATAQAQLIEAQRELERVNEGPKDGDVALLEAQIAKGYADYETYSVGPDPDDVALAEARISNAEAQLAAAQEALADLELVAPFDGVIAEVYVNPSEWVAPGSPILLIADLENLQIETTDLNEIDAAQIAVGDSVIVTFDALPEIVLNGTVTSIAPKAAEGSGVNYPVVVKLDEIPTELRWGMTAFVDIEIE